MDLARRPGRLSAGRDDEDEGRNAARSGRDRPPENAPRVLPGGRGASRVGPVRRGHALSPGDQPGSSPGDAAHMAPHGRGVRQASGGLEDGLGALLRRGRRAPAGFPLALPPSRVDGAGGRPPSRGRGRFRPRPDDAARPGRCPDQPGAGPDGPRRCHRGAIDDLSIVLARPERPMPGLPDPAPKAQGDRRSATGTRGEPNDREEGQKRVPDERPRETGSPAASRACRATRRRPWRISSRPFA